MSEEINLNASLLSATEDAFDNFQANATCEEEEFLTLSDIAPQQTLIPHLRDDLNDIPFDNEVVLDSIGNDHQAQVNNHNGNDSQFLQKSDNEQHTFRPKDDHNVSSDNLGEKNNVIEDSSAMIQDSFLSTTLDQSDTYLEIPVQETKYPRRTTRGRIANTAKYPMINSVESNPAVPPKRRPGRPKRGPPVQSSAEPDSTNLDSSLLQGVETDSSINESTPQTKRGRQKKIVTPKIKQTSVRKPQRKSQVDNAIADSTKPEVVNQIEVNSINAIENIKNTKPNTSKRKKKKTSYDNEPSQLETNNVNSNIEVDDGDDVSLSQLKNDNSNIEDDDGDDVSLSQLKNDLKDNEKPPQENEMISESIPETALVNSNLISTPYAENKLISDNNEMNIDDVEKNLARILCEESDTEDAAANSSKSNLILPVVTASEKNTDQAVPEFTAETNIEKNVDTDCLLVESPSKRRRVAKRTFVYDEGSEEEDPFANIESSDEEPKRRKKGTKYFSDDEYIPKSGSKKKGGGKIRSSSSESEDIEEDDDLLKKKKSPYGVSPFKKGRKSLKVLNAEKPEISTSQDTKISTIRPKCLNDDIEECLETTRIKIDENLRPPAEAWAKSNEFQNFITNNSGLKIKKVSSKESTDVITPLEIPVIDPTKLKKSVEISTQTKKVSTSHTSVQTSAPYDIPMKMKIDLTPGQSVKACEFLTSVVKTTAELGQLMSQKSEDFINKKINTENVTDTIKMDYCVRKSFLLFKLAKHNLLQMEEDLANQYEAFLNENKLSLCRELPKQIVSKPKDDSDSDCEIIEVVGVSGSAAPKEKPKPKVNPKTVFLNKELSIKIAKKPSVPEKPVPGKKKLEIKGRHAVWINKNVMVKKVTAQSFLAQDSRNKKPPDVITEKMVSDFFTSYNRKKVLLTCAQLINTDWTSIKRQYVCYYFVNDMNAVNTVIATNNNIEPEEIDAVDETHSSESPKKLFSLCSEVIFKCINSKTRMNNLNNNKKIEKFTCNVAGARDTKGPVTLVQLCLDAIKNILYKDLGSHDVNNDNGLEFIFEKNIKELPDVNKIVNRVATNDLNEHCVINQEIYNQEKEDSITQFDKKQVLPLTSICYKQIVKILLESDKSNSAFIQDDITLDKISSIDNSINDLTDTQITCNEPKLLFTICVEFIQYLQGSIKRYNHHAYSHAILNRHVKPLKTLAFDLIKDIISPINISTISHSAINTKTLPELNDNFTIDSVNTLSEEAFNNLQEPVRIRKQSQCSSEHSSGYDNNDYVDHSEIDYNAANAPDDNGWASQLQLQEFRSCFESHVTNTSDTEETVAVPEPNQVSLRIKSEPLDEFPEETVDTSIVKSEPIHPTSVNDLDEGLRALNEMTHIPDNIVTKRELIESTRAEDSHALQSGSTYNVEKFEKFMNSNKMIQSMDESMLHDDEVFSQSGLRIRRQHEPDLDPGHDTNLGLLVPHNFETLHLVDAKGSLMESSSDDDNDSKKSGKKKEKKKKKPKKDTKTTPKETVPSKEITAVYEKPQNDLAMLTRRMRDRIRQEDKKIASSDSDEETLYLFPTKEDKNKKVNDDNDDSDSDTYYMFNKDENNHVLKPDDVSKSKVKASKAKPSKTDINKAKETQEIVQCNNVDSTEKICCNETDINEFSGFTAIDQNETSNYQKLMQFVYDAIIPASTESIKTDNTKDNKAEEVNDGPTKYPESQEPVELLEPTLPFLNDEPSRRPGPKRYKNKNLTEAEPKPTFTERHGWNCYSISPDDTKLYATPQIILEKLPESFVEIYKEYQDVTEKNFDDEEVDRLINLQSLTRSGKDLKDFKERKPKTKSKMNTDGSSEQNSGTVSRASSPTYSDNFDELVPSDDDDDANPENETPPPMPAHSSENNLARNLLMDDHESDSDGGGNKIKQKTKDPNTDQPVTDIIKTKPGSKSKNVPTQDPESLMLTADKMMNKELNLLHAPIVLQDGVRVKPEVKETSPQDETKQKMKHSRRTRLAVKNDDDSSSEEEKQWVSTKEKLLKRMGKKEDLVADETKRAKLVNEFIERRNEVERKDKPTNRQMRNKRNKSKRLERQKQLRFLSQELYNQGADGALAGKRGPAPSLFTGRRNIRKVIDKKSLARSTVMANMEEFERKRRLTMKQNKLREVLGCEDGVNVLVINDEVCLEYDFEEQRPVVAVHPFFTKVMKAHQYEGVKFMWDACFESLEHIASGNGGGGCILAHCMGLGKTLQVLALLHTVLTHPRANMHRVLVCCPLSTVLNWVDEIHKWIGPVTHEIKVFELSKLRKTYERAYQLEDWYSGGGIFIIGYELFRSLTTLDPEIDEIRPTIINKIRTALLDPGPDIIICDEGHLLKNDCSVLAVAMSRVVTKRRIVLTGTPMQNNLREYFCMVNFIKPNLLGTYSEYSNRFENPIMNGQHRDSVEADIKLMKARTHILHKVLEGCLQRQEASVLYPYLPKKHEYTVFIPLTRCQWDLYNHYIDFYTRTQKQKQILKDFHILQKIWSHPQVLQNFQMKDRAKKHAIKVEKLEDDLALADIKADIKPDEMEVWWLQYLDEGAMLDSLESSNKFVAVFRILHECVSLGDKVLIFSTSLFSLDALEYFLKKINKWSLGQEYYRLDGSVPPEVRQKWCREFNAEHNLNTKLFLISTRAGCLGLNMTAANRVIILDTSWNPAHDIQSIFRVYRFGQKKDCYIYRLVALGTMEQKIYERSVTKQAVACRVVDEQQIDRHYNLSELTELYSVDESGMSVAGGVAVGVGDVVLLRVARDAAIHAVHEHDSLLRGEHEQNLPEHERDAAWSQFQLEHENKQKQNDLHVKKPLSKGAMKRLEIEHLRKQKEEENLRKQQDAIAQTQNLAVPIKIEQSVADLLQPKEEPGVRQRGKRRKHIVQCRIPIASAPQPGPSNELEDQEKVNKITQLLIKHNFVQSKSGSSRISDLVSKVKCMIATGQPMTLGPGYDELSASIAGVLLNHEQASETSMPPLTDVRPPSPPPVEETRRGRKKKQIAPAPEPPPTLPPEAEPQPETSDGRRRRKAAIAAEKHFDNQQDVISLDDDGDDWQGDDDTVTVDDWLAETEANQPIPEPPPIETPPIKKEKKKKDKPIKQEMEKTITKTIDSILLSDDEEFIAPSVQTNESEEIIELHPSLLTNANFIQIVAHTYRTGNPMLDEDAATLAAQYSTLKMLKESESEGKPITSGPVYDIAVQVLGKSVLKKLQLTNPKSNTESTAASKKLQSLMGHSEPPAPPAPPAAVKKPRIGPKSKVLKMDLKELKMELNETPSKPDKTGKIQRVSKKNAMFTPTSKPQPSTSTLEESILPDDDVIISEPAPVDKKPTILRKTLVPPNVTPIALRRGPAVPTQPQKPTDATICLDSDDEEQTPSAPPPSVQSNSWTFTVQPGTKPAPVPVALTGPNARAIPLAAPRKPRYFQLSTCGTRAIPLEGLVPVTTVPSDSQPVPIITTTKPTGLHFPTQPIPVSLTGPGSEPVPISLLGPDSPAPVPMSLVDASGRPIGLAGATFGHARPPPHHPAPAPAPAPPAKPADLTRISKAGLINILQKKKRIQASPNLQVNAELPTTIIEDDEPIVQTITHRTVTKQKIFAAKPTETIPLPGPAPTPKADKFQPAKRKSHRVASSSSSSSDARSPSPAPHDPLAILRDVVHIQAPERTDKPTVKHIKPETKKPAPKTNKSIDLTAPKPGPSKTSNIKPETKKPAPKTNKSIDLTAPKPGPSKTSKTNNADFVRKKDIFDSLFTKTPSGKATPKASASGARPTPSKLIGTSKSIILDGKSKALKVEPKASTPKLVDKRPAPSPSAAANKKPKLMTLKDFDIDDIDGIIELD